MTDGKADFEFSREANVAFNEVALIAALFRQQGLLPGAGTMIDVGAHSGGTFPLFLEAGWTVFAFEPDPVNRADIPQRYQTHPRFHLDARAVSDGVRDDLPFYQSKESTGISSLIPFRDSHAEATRVSTTTLADLARDKQPGRINFLKIDAEGHDFSVLKGNDWTLMKPDIVMCECEDSKTIPLGFDFDDQYRYFQELGYTLWVSEWWPVIRYGIRHQWRSFYPGGQRRPPSDGWSNLIAFREPPDPKLMYQLMLEGIDWPGDASELALARSQIATSQLAARAS